MVGSAPPRRMPRSFDGPYLDAACKLDAAAPGFLNRLLYASNLRRAATFATLLQIEFERPAAMAERLRPFAPAGCLPEIDPCAQVARALLVLREREIIAALFGSVPDGFLGLLGRLGSQPLPDSSLYALLHDLLGNPAHQARAKLLRQIPGLVSLIKIVAVARLDPVLLHPAVLARMSDVERVTAANAAVAVIRSVVPDATDEALRQSLDGLNATGPSLGEWARGWLRRRMSCLPVEPPIPANDPYLRLIQGRDMADLGRRFQNCAADRVGYVALGSRLYYEWIGFGEPAVVELRTLHGSGGNCFVIEDLKGARNSEPEAEVTKAICKRLSDAGVLTYRDEAAGHGVGSALRHLLGVWECEFIEPDADISNLLDEAA